MNVTPESIIPNPGYSPVIKSNDGESKEKDLDFAGAIKAMLDGKKVTRREWQDDSVFGFFDEKTEILMIFRSGTHQWIVSKGDVMNDDWEIVK